MSSKITVAEFKPDHVELLLPDSNNPSQSKSVDDLFTKHETHQKGGKKKTKKHTKASHKKHTKASRKKHTKASRKKHTKASRKKHTKASRKKHTKASRKKRSLLKKIFNLRGGSGAANAWGGSLTYGNYVDPSADYVNVPHIDTHGVTTTDSIGINDINAKFTRITGQASENRKFDNAVNQKSGK